MLKSGTVALQSRVRSYPRLRRAGATIFLLAAAGVVLVAVAGCGSSKPAYCADRSKLEAAVTELPSAAKTGGTAGLQSQLASVESATTAVTSSAKSDFPTETSQLSANVDQLKTAVQTLPSSPSATDIAAITLDATAIVNAAKAFTTATNDKCQ